jgi:nucleotide-binding universal stress UspA family protein
MATAREASMCVPIGQADWHAACLVWSMQRILVPVDGSACASRAAAFAAQLARTTGARITLMHVLDASPATGLGLVALAADELQAVLSRSATGSFDAALVAIGQPGIEVDRFVALGHPAMEIVRYASDIGADLVVIGSRGRSAVKELVLGSVSDQVARHSSCPVTLVR